MQNDMKSGFLSKSSNYNAFARVSSKYRCTDVPANHAAFSALPQGTPAVPMRYDKPAAWVDMEREATTTGRLGNTVIQGTLNASLYLSRVFDR